MIYSGADLIRTSGQQQERLERLQVAKEVKPTEQTPETKSSLDEETQGALLRFARFINKESKGKKPKPQPAPRKQAHPYTKAMEPLQKALDTGLTIDIYV